MIWIKFFFVKQNSNGLLHGPSEVTDTYNVIDQPSANNKKQKARKNMAAEDDEKCKYVNKNFYQNKNGFTSKY